MHKGNINMELLDLLTSEQAWHYLIFPTSISDSHILLFATEKSNSNEISNELQLVLGKNIEFEIIKHEELLYLLQNYYQKQNEKQAISNIHSDIIEDLLNEAMEMSCSDIHIEHFEKSCRIRFRIDGKLIERYTIPEDLYPALVNKIKITANLDISEKRLPQDGRILHTATKGNEIDIRVSSLPSLYGEKIVMRLLSKDAGNISLEELGFNHSQKEDFIKGIKKPFGLVLISGPTGSGKTTTLYASLKLLNKVSNNILTIEDPIEYTLEGINQVQLNESIGLGFVSSLRTFLRQDPDIIMLGEIRDAETAQMAIRASLTGHLVLSTIHTNSAWGTISRLTDMGVPPYLLSGTLNLSVAQRLVRLLCPHCKKIVNNTESKYTKKISINKPVYEAGQCPACHFTGYKGRKAIYEIIPITEQIAEHIRNNSNDISDSYEEINYLSLKASAINLFLNGETSYAEIEAIL
jgi:type IV pilus assembly protein PilB